MSKIGDFIERLAAGGKYPRYIVQHPFNPTRRRTSSKHVKGRTRPRGLKKAKRARRKAEKLARRAQRN